MPRVLFFVLFLLVGTTVIAGWHYYMWARLVRDPQPSQRVRTAGKLLFALLALALPATMLAGRMLPSDALRPAYLLGFGWLGTSFILVMALVLTDIGKLGHWVVRRARGSGPVDPERRKTLARIVAGVTVTTGVAGSAYGVASALGAIPIERVQVKLRRLTEAMIGTKIVQLTDMHIGPTLRRAWVEGVVARVNALEPDVIVITGDLVDGSVEQLRRHVAPLGKLRAKHGVFFVTGNHEYYSGVNDWIAELTRLGVRVLRNERVRIGGEEGFDLAGVDDWSASRHGEGHGHDLEAAMRGADPSREVVLLAHQPRAIWDAAKHGIGLQLSGHTHGGQIYPWYYFVFLQQPFVSGLHAVEETMLYVSRGTGFWGPPIRVGAPPEITEVELLRG